MPKPPRPPLTLDELKTITRGHSCPVVRTLLWEIKRLKAIESWARQLEQGISAHPSATKAVPPPMVPILEGLRGALDGGTDRRPT